MSPEEKQRERDICRVTLVGSVCNLLLTLFKFFAGLVGHSAAMLADATHSLSDLVTDFLVLVFVRLAGRPQDKRHEYGHGKFETMATAAIGFLLLLVGVWICWNGLSAIYDCVRGIPLPTPAPVALVAALVSVLSKELLYHYTVIVGRRCHSSATVANAWHHRSDAFSSVGTALGVGGAVFLGPQWHVLDPVAAVVVSVFIIKVSVRLMRPSVGELLDGALPDADEQFIIDCILEQPGVSDPHNLRTRAIGSYCSIDVHFRMSGDTPLSEAHRAASEIEARLRRHFGRAAIINTHVEPLK